MVLNNIEITAPVGDYETLAAAIKAKADSVYFGVEQLNMRSKSAKNFSINDLEKISEIVHENGLKCYLALNTIIYDHDIFLMRKIIDEAIKARIDAIIATDISTILYAYEKGIPVHASTQLNISNYEALKYFSKYIDVFVLARELSLEQVKNIVSKIKEDELKGPSGNLVRIELFAHGALCMAISGKCYLSLHEFNSSANRGACQQTCRRSYIVTDKETGYQLEIDNEYIMSPKDLATIDFLDKVIESGVSILKIEGRARPPEYVKIVTEVYKEAVNAYFNNDYTKEKIEIWKQKLSTVFNRGFWDGYYLGRKLGEWSNVYGSKATKRKRYIGDITNFFKKINVAEITLKAGDLKLNDTLLIIGSTTGVIELVVKEIRKDDIPINHAHKGEVVSIPVNEVVRRSDKVYLFEDSGNN